MSKKEQMLGNDADPSAPRRLLAAVINQAVADLSNTAERKASEEFFWGCDSKISDCYLGLLGYDAKQFKQKLKAKIEAGEVAVAA